MIYVAGVCLIDPKSHIYKRLGHRLGTRMISNYIHARDGTSALWSQTLTNFHFWKAMLMSGMPSLTTAPEFVESSAKGQ
jgi:hypothetical protein